MTRGPKPQPGEIKLKKGNPGKRTVVTTPDVVQDITNDAPGWLSDGAKSVWNILVPDLKHLRFLKATDHTALARYCDHFARWLSLKEKVDDKGESYETESRHGKMQRLNPDFVALMRIDERLMQFEDRFGLSPSSRQKILQQMATSTGELPLGNVPEVKDEDGSPMGILQRAAGSHAVN